jgi:hypothetical protein
LPTQFDEKQFAFKAWTDKVGSDGPLKLHVHGHIAVEDETLLYQLGRKNEQGYFQEELFLIISPDPKPGKNNVQIQYNEDLPTADKYKKISILTKTGQVFEIKEISRAI